MFHQAIFLAVKELLIVIYDKSTPIKQWLIVKMILTQ